MSLCANVFEFPRTCLNITHYIQISHLLCECLTYLFYMILVSLASLFSCEDSIYNKIFEQNYFTCNFFQVNVTL